LFYTAKIQQFQTLPNKCTIILYIKTYNMFYEVVSEL
jgi:hypothetical protein